MFKISITDTKCERKLVVEGKLVAPWVAELRKAWEDAGEGLDQRRLVIDLANVTVIGADGEDAILRLMKEGAKFSCNGVLTKYLLKRLARRCQSKLCDAAKPTQLGD